MGNDPELCEVIRIVRAASERVELIYKSGFSIEFKEPSPLSTEKDPVTRADRESDKLICAMLTASFPGDAIVSEESVPQNSTEVSSLVSSPRVWFVDPLDGTQEFSEYVPEFAVMVGLAVAGQAKLGVIALPLEGLILAGRVDGTAFFEDREGVRRPVFLSKTYHPQEIKLIVSRSHQPSFLEKFIEKSHMHLRIRQIIPCGSVGVKVARLIQGQADFYIHGPGPKRWDTCGPEAVLRAAGGIFSDLSGASIHYADPDLTLRTGILAGPLSLHGHFLKVMSELRKSAA